MFNKTEEKKVTLVKRKLTPVDMFQIQCIVFGHLWTLATLHNLWSVSI